MQDQDFVEWVKERKFYKYEDVEWVMNRLKNLGYLCIDVGGSTPDYKETVTIGGVNDGNENPVWFEYIRCRGPECSVSHYLCLKPGEGVKVRRTGFEYRGDDLGCHDEWDEKIQFTNDGNQIISQRIEGGHHIECPGASHRIERTPPTKQSDVRDLYYL
jgi:hypothetical protein